MKTYVVSYLVQSTFSEQEVRDAVQAAHDKAGQAVLGGLFGLTVSRLTSAQRVRQVTGEVPTMAVVRPKRGKAKDEKALREEIERLQVLNADESNPTRYANREAKIQALWDQVEAL